jgi:hypothetical protein
MPGINFAGDAFNEGVGHGGIIVNMIGGGRPQGVIIDPFTVDPETMKILQPDQYGTTQKKMGRLKNISATGTAQLPTTIVGAAINAVPLLVGDSFIDPILNLTWWVSKAGDTYQSGQFWKQEVELEQQLNPEI